MPHQNVHASSWFQTTIKKIKLFVFFKQIAPWQDTVEELREEEETEVQVPESTGQRSLQRTGQRSKHGGLTCVTINVCVMTSIAVTFICKNFIKTEFFKQAYSQRGKTFNTKIDEKVEDIYYALVNLPSITCKCHLIYIY